MLISPDAKIKTAADLFAWRHQLRWNNKRLVLTNGCFDLVHRGHVQYLYEARLKGDALLVALNSDRSVRSVKGPARPVINENDRAYLLGSLQCVDGIYIFDTPDITGLLADVVPDIYVKGGDYTLETIVQAERRVMERLGVRIEFLSLVPGISTTEIIRRLGTV